MSCCKSSDYCPILTEDSKIKLLADKWGFSSGYIITDELFPEQKQWLVQNKYAEIANED